MSYAETEIEYQRLAILQLLDKSSRYTQNDALLRDRLGDVGLPISSDGMRIQLAWLSDQGLLTTQSAPGMGTHIVTLTERGRDLAMGLQAMPGIARPMPGA